MVFWSRTNYLKKRKTFKTHFSFIIALSLRTVIFSTYAQGIHSVMIEMENTDNFSPEDPLQMSRLAAYQVLKEFSNFYSDLRNLGEYKPLEDGFVNGNKYVFFFFNKILRSHV